MIDPSGNLIWHSVCLEVIMQNPALLFKGREQCCWGIQMQVSLSLSLGFKPSHTHTHTHTPETGCHPFYRSLSLYASKMAHWSCMSRPSTPCSPRCLQGRLLRLSLRREVTPLTPIILSLSHSHPHSHFLTVRVRGEITLTESHPRDKVVSITATKVNLSYS